MDVDELYHFIKAYLKFRNDLSKNIKYNNEIKNFNDCYLIEASWANILEKYKISVENKSKILLINVSFPEKDPIFINDFSDAVNFINDNNKFILIHKSLIEYIYNTKSIILKKIPVFYVMEETIN